MTLLYRAGDEILLHAPREVLAEAAEPVRQRAAELELKDDPLHQHLSIFANSLRAESQHELPNNSPTEDWMNT